MTLLLFFLTHSSIAVVVAASLALLTPLPVHSVAGFSLLAGALLGLPLARRLRRALDSAWPETPWSSFEIFLVALLMYAAYRNFGWLLFRVGGPEAAGLATLSKTNYGDLPLHLQLIRHFAESEFFLSRSPYFAEQWLRYPFGADLYNALWEAVGCPTRGHLFITGIGATALALALLRRMGGALTVAAFFLSGNFSALAPIANGQIAEIATDHPGWGDFFLTIWLTQRGFLWALPLGLLLLALLPRHFRFTKNSEMSGAVSSQILIGLLCVLAIFHLHSLVAICLILFVQLLVEQRNIDRKRAILFLLLAAVFLSPIVFYFTNFLARVGSGHWIWGWQGGSFIHQFGFWCAVPIVALIAAFRSHKLGQLSQRAEIFSPLIASVLVFAFFYFYMLSPWDWDNTKVLIWPFLVFAVAAQPLVRAMEKKSGTRALAFAAILAASIGPLVRLMVYWEQPQKRAVTLWSIKDLDEARAVLQRAPRDAVFASSLTPVHVLDYYGRTRSLGYDGHLWSYGLSFMGTRIIMERALTGDAEALRQLRDRGVTHIYWGPKETEIYGQPSSLLLSGVSLLASSGRHQIFVLRHP